MFIPPARISGQPAYRFHKSSGRAVVTLNYADGTRKDVQLGSYGSKESVVKYHKVMADWNADKGLVAPTAAQPDAITVAELIIRFWEGHVVTYYRHPDGSATSEQENYRQALRSLRSMYADEPAKEFDPPALETWLHAVTRPERSIIDAGGNSKQARGWSRTNANKHLSRVKALFSWGVRKKLVTSDVYQSLLTVPGLRYGRTDARETTPVTVVSEDFIEAIAPHVSRQVATMARLQSLCGARPGELCSMRGMEIKTTGDVWVFEPSHHKTAYRGHTRKIQLGPRSQALLKPFLKADLTAPLFSPAEAEADRLVALHKARKTRPSCGNRPGSNRDRSKPRKLAAAYTPAAYRRAIARACEVAFPPPAKLARIKVKGRKAKALRWETDPEWKKRLGSDAWAELEAWQNAHHFHPHQARHTAGTRAREQFGLQGAQVMLGHKHARITEMYAESSSVLAAKVASEIG